VQIKLYGYDDADDPDAYIQKVPITLDEDSGDYIWDLPIASEKINVPDPVTAVELRFVAASKTDSTQKLTSAWKRTLLSTIQGNTNISLSAVVYPIVKETNDTYFAGIKGVSGIAHNRDAIAETPVSLTITPSANYGVQGGSVSISGGGNVYVAPDGTFSFTTPSGLGPVTVSAEFFHLEGTAAIAGANAQSYAPKTIEAYGEKWDEEKEEYVWDLIGSADIAAAGGTWTIPIANGYVSGGSPYGSPSPTNRIQFKVTSKAANEPDQVYVTTESLTSLAGNNTLTIAVALFTVTGVQTETTIDSVKILWEKADWATGGYKIYRSIGGSPIALPDIAATATSYTDSSLTPGTRYDYYIVGLYGTAKEGEKVSFSALTVLPAPQNVTATKAPESYYPFKVSVSWDAVANADYYAVYRDGIYIDMVSSASYDDVSYKSLDQSYSYQVVASKYSGVASALSVASQVYFPTTSYLSPSSSSGGNIGSEGEYNYYRFYAANWGSYYFVLEESGFDVYAYLYVNGSQYAGFGSTYSIGLSLGDEVVLAVRAYYYGDTGSYGIRVESY
jgi:hypothetical protein